MTVQTVRQRALAAWPARRSSLRAAAHEGPAARLAGRSASSSAPAWTAAGATVAFIALTCWWLTRDRSIPIFDAGDHLQAAFEFHAMLSSGDLLGPLRAERVYPPLGELIGALSAFVGGVNVASPIVGENVVFVSLLSLGCYRTGRLLFDARAGMLACVFALGSPLLISLFHVFLLDAPEAAVVALSLWLILASDRFAHTKIAALAGLACGVGLLVKVQFPIYVAGVVLAALLDGGWRNRRGVGAFVVVALVVGAPWYIGHASQLPTMISIARESSAALPANSPPTWSLASFSWYAWSFLNCVLLAFLSLFALAGAGWMLAAQARRSGGVRGLRSPRLAGQRQLLCGAFVAWLGITVTHNHDIRYALPLLPYLAAIATGWTCALARTRRLLAGCALALAALANTLGTTFGIGLPATLALSAHPAAGEALPDHIVLTTDSGFLAGAPSRDGDVPDLLRALHARGVATLLLLTSEGEQPDFSFEGLIPLATIAHIGSRVQVVEFSDAREPRIDTRAIGARTVMLLHRPLARGQPAPCTRLSDGTGVWVLRRTPASGRLALYCPSRSPAYYGAVTPAGEPLAGG